MARLVWQKERYALQAGAMDDAHEAFVALINRLAEASDQEEAHLLKQLLVHCEDHFAQEARWMQTCALPNAEPHLRDHEDVLARLRIALDEVRAGQCGAGRALAEGLADWFERHALTLDAALAFTMQQSVPKKHVGIVAVG